MLKNMFKVAWRNAIANKQFTILNILGLSIGITASLLITLYIQEELSYDNFHKDADQVYRINQPLIWGDWDAEFGSTAPGVAVALREDIPEFTEVLRIHDSGENLVTYEPKNGDPVSFKEARVYTAEANFFNLFSFPVLEGNPETALVEPLSIIITKSMANKYFGEEGAMGKILEVRQGENAGLFKVTAVLEDIPTNSHIQFDMMTSMSTYRHIKAREWTWVWTTFVTYVKVAPGADLAKINAKLQAIPPKWAAPAIERAFGESYAEFVPDGKKWTLTMQPIREAYLHSPITGNRIGPSGSIAYVKIFGAVGILVLMLSCINFMNLSTARSAGRAKEVGVRKVLGSGRKSIANQFVFESIVFTLVGTVIALILCELSINAFNSIANKTLSLQTELSNPIFLGGLLVFILGLGLVAGSYPAFYLSSFKPIQALKGKISNGFRGKGIRNTLVVFQFTISVALIITTFFIQKQLNYTSNYNLGFEDENILQLHNLELLDHSSIETLQNRLKQNPVFTQVGYSDLVAPNIFSEDKYKAEGPENNPTTLNRLIVDEDYVDLLSPKFIVGRNFDDNRASDKYAVILNVSGAKTLGFGSPETYDNDSPIGKHVTFPTSEGIKFEVIGVVEDFNYNSLRMTINPLMIADKRNDELFDIGTSYLSARIDPLQVNSTEKMTALLDGVKSELASIKPGLPFEYSFMDEDFERSFRTEQRMTSVLNIFTVMALSIACIGLFGLAAFTSEQRTKELGVRKVLGASVKDIVLLFSTEFTRLVIIAILIATPLAYYAVKTWLADFAYQTPITVSIFIIAGGSALLIAWGTISFQSLKSAYRNPVEALRDE
ncbi:ABC transporter permease [Roseivirga echinicomitans]